MSVMRATKVVPDACVPRTVGDVERSFILPPFSRFDELTNCESTDVSAAVHSNGTEERSLAA
jgi:hypothetical protein